MSILEYSGSSLVSRLHDRHAAAIFPLTSAAWLGNSELPNYVRRSRRLCRAPHVEKSGFSCFLPPLHPLAFMGLWGCGYILAENNVLMFARLRRPYVSRGALFPPFFVPNPQLRRCIMLRFFLSSHFLRLRYRLQSLAERSASILTLAAVFFMAFVGVTA